LIYWYKNIYAWNFQTGTPNLDGIIRLPGRLINILVFWIAGSLGASYFYYFFSLALTGLAFFLFVRYFLNIKSKATMLLVTALFVFNPAFIGNSAKIGLVAAAAMLPLGLVLLKRFFVTKRMRYLLLLIAALNYSLLHPFTFAVNILGIVIYGGRAFYQNRHDSGLLLKKLVIAGVAALLINSYFLLPVIGVGTIDKAALSQDLSAVPVDYTALIQIANAGDPVTTFSLAKNVFKDFDFYNSWSQFLFLLGTAGIYGTLIYIFLTKKHELSHRDRLISGVLLAFGLATLIMTSGVPLVSSLIAKLIGLPGGWIFRSPLKWQLYVPFFIIGALAVQLTALKDLRIKRWVMLGLWACLIAQSSFVSIDVYDKLLRPRSVSMFAALSNRDMTNKRLLYLEGSSCSKYSRDQPVIMTELNQVLNSKQVQVKHAAISSYNNIKLSDYDYVLTCKEDDNVFAQGYESHKLAEIYDNGSFHLYKNKLDTATVNIMPQVFLNSDNAGIAQKDRFVNEVLGIPFNYVRDGAGISSQQIGQTFNGMSYKNMRDGAISVRQPANQGNGSKIYYVGDKGAYKISGDTVMLSDAMLGGYLPLVAGRPITVNSPGGKGITYVFSDTRHSFDNLIQNGSFEIGLWQKKVSDCFQFDNQGQIGMELNGNDASNGANSLALSSNSHIACTSTSIDNLIDRDKLLIQFKYKSDRAKSAAFSVTFNNPGNTVVTGHTQVTSAKWSDFSKTIDVPPGATAGKFFLYGYPGGYGEQQAVTQYDEVSVVDVPSSVSNYFFVSGAANPGNSLAKVFSDTLNPTMRKITLNNVGGTINIGLEDSYDKNWILRPAKKTHFNKVAAGQITHYKVNDFDNGWKMNVDKLCTADSVCTKNSDGTYNIVLINEFIVQRYLYAGLMLGGLTIVGGGIFAVGRRYSRKP